MIAVQAVDGHFYVNPAFWQKNWAVIFNDEPVLFYKKAGWKTARKVLRPAGIQAAWAGGPDEDVIVLDNKLASVTKFKLRLTGPIPVPVWFDAVLEGPPAPGDFEIISFEVKS